MYKKDAQDLSSQFLMASFVTCSHKGKSKFSVLNETEHLKPRLGCCIFVDNSRRVDVHNNTCYAGKPHRMTWCSFIESSPNNDSDMEL